MPRSSTGPCATSGPDRRYTASVPVGSAFHARTLPLAGSLSFRDWAGFYAVSAYEAHHEHEYNAIRNGCALIDISPLFKYHLTGPDAIRLVDRVITRDATKIEVGQVVYTPWCDDEGKTIDDGTVTRLGPDRLRWTAADPNLRWLTQHAEGLDVRIEDVSEQIAALALQGPTSARLLAADGSVTDDEAPRRVGEARCHTRRFPRWKSPASRGRSSPRASARGS